MERERERAMWVIELMSACDLYIKRYNTLLLFLGIKVDEDNIRNRNNENFYHPRIRIPIV